MAQGNKNENRKEMRTKEHEAGKLKGTDRATKFTAMSDNHVKVELLIYQPELELLPRNAIMILQELLANVDKMTSMDRGAVSMLINVILKLIPKEGDMKIIAEAA